MKNKKLGPIYFTESERILLLSAMLDMAEADKEHYKHEGNFKTPFYEVNKETIKLQHDLVVKIKRSLE